MSSLVSDVRLQDRPMIRSWAAPLVRSFRVLPSASTLQFSEINVRSSLNAEAICAGSLHPADYAQTPSANLDVRTKRRRRSVLRHHAARWILQIWASPHPSFDFNRAEIFTWVLLSRGR